MRSTFLGAAALLAAATLIPVTSAAAHYAHVPYYQLIDVGTFGGPHADVEGPAHQITARGAVLGLADTATPNAQYPNDWFCGGSEYTFHAFSYAGGHLTDLGALPGNNCSVVFEVNRHGLGAGASVTGRFDPRVNVTAVHPVLFRDGRVVDIGTLPGGSEGFAVGVNDRGQVLGISNSSRRGPEMPDFFDWHGQIRGFVWQDGVMRDLGTLGGPGTVPATINARGQVSGDSYVDRTVNPTTGFPTQHSFLWQDGRMRDLGSLGGARTFTWWMNRHGQVVGRATLPGDRVWHAFTSDGRRLRDLGTLGGSFSEANRVNDHGVIAGGSYTTDDESFHTVMWRHGDMTDLSPNECTFPEWINNRDEIVGGACSGESALLWRDGVQYDLNTLVGTTDVHLATATFIDDHGRIAALGLLPNGAQHVFLLEPRSHR